MFFLAIFDDDQQNEGRQEKMEDGEWRVQPFPPSSPGTGFSQAWTSLGNDVLALVYDMNMESEGKKETSARCNAHETADHQLWLKDADKKNDDDEPRLSPKWESSHRPAKERATGNHVQSVA